MWQDNMRRLEAHGDELKLAPVFKINALQILMAGKATEYLAVAQGELFQKEKFDSSLEEKMQHGGENLDVGAVWGWSWNDGAGGTYDQGDGAYVFGFKSKGRSKGKGN